MHLASSCRSIMLPSLTLQRGWQVEVRSEGSDGGAVSYQLDPEDPRTLAGDAHMVSPQASLAALASLPPLPAGSARLQASVRDHDQEIMSGAGLRTFGGGATLGRAHPYRVLRFTPGTACRLLPCSTYC